MTGKTQFEYEFALTTLKQIIKKNNWRISFKKVMTDFETALREAIKSSFGGDIELFGCYWHFCRALWKRA